ncbi:HTH-type transcriptional regulator protein [Gossypium arboreum]|uniref:HTH-type transcriptional regulator protein n=2 Tax=Gossypium arboreum TaxID=29729 RepID=A0A0B0NN84_GOSAR|nr:HTH-type transcriptional regulator protein [Gossypium arboreum]
MVLHVNLKSMPMSQTDLTRYHTSESYVMTYVSYTIPMVHMTLSDVVTFSILSWIQLFISHRNSTHFHNNQTYIIQLKYVYLHMNLPQK